MSQSSAEHLISMTLQFPVLHCIANSYSVTDSSSPTEKKKDGFVIIFPYHFPSVFILMIPMSFQIFIYFYFILKSKRARAKEQASDSIY